jgi:ABC-type sugar transport system substrate-binding protein
VRSRQVLVLGAGVLALVVAGCGGSSSTATPAASSSDAAGTSSAAAPVKVALITKFPVAFFTAMDDAVKAFDEKTPGVEVSYFSCKSPSDVACQTAQIEDGVAKGFQALVITPMGPEVIPAMDAAADKGVKVILVDNNLDAFTKKTAVAATDNVKGGQAAGAYLKSVLKSGDSIGLMEGVRGVPALDARITGVKEALAGTGVKIVIGGAETKCDAAQGATVAEDLLTRNPNLTAIYSACDDPAIAAVKVVKDKGKKVLVMGYDGLPDAAKAIQAGDMRATIAQFPRKMAELGVQAAMDAVQGKPVEAFIDTGTELVTADNAATFLTFQ